MFNSIRSFEDRLSQWAEFRDNLEDYVDPIQATIDQYSKAPEVSIHTDPYDQTSWPTPWELIKENHYCAFCKLLGIAFTLQLTDSFSAEQFEIHIQRSDETHMLQKQNCQATFFCNNDTFCLPKNNPS